jgi:hypothetical protein
MTNDQLLGQLPVDPRLDEHVKPAVDSMKAAIEAEVMFELHGVVDEATHRRALAEVAKLVKLDPAPDTPAGRRLIDLVDRVIEYEFRVFPLPEAPQEQFRKVERDG